MYILKFKSSNRKFFFWLQVIIARRSSYTFLHSVVTNFRVVCVTNIGIYMSRIMDAFRHAIVSLLVLMKWLILVSQVHLSLHNRIKILYCSNIPVRVCGHTKTILSRKGVKRSISCYSLSRKLYFTFVNFIFLSQHLYCRAFVPLYYFQLELLCSVYDILWWPFSDFDSPF